MAAKDDAAAGRGGARGRGGGARVRHPSAAAKRTAEHRRTVLDPRERRQRRRGSCSCRSTTRPCRRSRSAHLHSEFPFPRRYDAEVIDRLRAGGAKAIALDIEFTHPTDPADDEALMEAMGQGARENGAGGHRSGAGGRTEVLGGPRTAPGTGRTGGGGDPHGRTRTGRCGGSPTLQRLEVFGVVTAEVATGTGLGGSMFEGGTLPIDYRGAAGNGALDLLLEGAQRASSPQPSSGKIVDRRRLGADLAGRPHDSDDGSGQMPGPEIWANATSTLLRGVPLGRRPIGWTSC